MHNDVFQNANSVFSGVLRDNKEKGFDVSKPKSSISPGDLEKLYENYFLPGLQAENTEVLQHKVFFDLMYYTARRGRQGLRGLRKEWFELKKTAEGREYIEITINETTKKDQGDNCSTRSNTIYNDDNIMFAQPGSDRCPVNSFIHYTSLLNEKLPWLFQRANVPKKRYDAMVVGKHTLGNMMAVISEKAELSKRYTNHNIRRTSGNAMRKAGASAPAIAHHLKQKNLQSMMHYLDQPTIEDKQNNAQMLFEYMHTNKEPAPPQPQRIENVQQQLQLPQAPPNPIPVVPQNKENVYPDNAIIPFEPQVNENPTIMPAMHGQIPVPAPHLASTNNSQVVTNQVRQAPVMFGGATFHNCTINMNVPQ